MNKCKSDLFVGICLILRVNKVNELVQIVNIIFNAANLGEHFFTHCARKGTAKVNAFLFTNCTPSNNPQVA